MPDPTSEEITNLEEVITTYGARDPIFVDKEGEVIDGRQRLKIYRKKGIKAFPVQVP